MELRGGAKRNKIYIMNGGTPISELREYNCFRRINKDTEALSVAEVLCVCITI